MNRQHIHIEIQSPEPSLSMRADDSVCNESSTHLNYALDENQMQLFADDDLVFTLSNAYENRRARQVFEWETIRRKAASTRLCA